MAYRIDRGAYAAMFGPTVGDKVRLADTDLLIETAGPAVTSAMRRITSRFPWMMAMGLLISWATPAVTSPSAASFSAATSCRST